MRKITEFKNLHKGETIYVFGSGATLNYLAPGFFDDKTCVTTNFAGSVFGLKKYYCFSHYHEDSRKEHAKEQSIAVFTPDKEHGTDGYFIDIMDGIVLFEATQGRPGASFDPHGKDWPTREDSIIVGSSGIHGAMHLAAYMGAKYIVLVGADCGTLGGNHRIDGYVEGDNHWQLYEMHLRRMKQRLNEVYGCQTYSLNPFINYSLEGTPYRGYATIN